MEAILLKLRLGIKRLMDILLCLVVIALGLPPFVLIAILVKLSSPGPVFFVQERVGMKKKPFRIFKFRSMIEAPTEEQAASWSEAQEARITPIGKLLRDYGLDELPQVVNILKGDMSIVGPRPPLPVKVKEYSEHQCKVFQMRPGVVSLGALKGRRSIPMEERIELHVQYVENWSLWLDVCVLVRSIPIILRRQDASDIVTR
jgi:lipopolysaccharide/colanic/teichoic acid biosynthesis glycosyltransferase